MKWSEMEGCGIEWHQVGWNGLKWDGMDLSGRNGINWDEMDLITMGKDCSGLKWSEIK
jgi:hypothetical protein